MALIHLEKDRGYFTACGRRVHNRRSNLNTWKQESFIRYYIERHGRDFCSKCASELIEKGLLVAAENTITDSYKELVDKLKTGMQSIHDQYIKATRKFAKESFAKMKVWSAKTREQWCISYNIPYAIEIQSRALTTRHLDRFDSERYFSMMNRREKESKIVEGGFKKYEASEVDAAERHYDACIAKLADRVTEKSLNTEKMKIETGRVRRNGIETMITDDVNVIRAWSIIAAGPIKRPHYRYLVK